MTTREVGAGARPRIPGLRYRALCTVAPVAPVASGSLTGLARLSD